jgi:hypothetical protein
LIAVALVTVFGVASLLVMTGPALADPPNRTVNSFSFGDGTGFACPSGLVFARFSAQKSGGPVSGSGSLQGSLGATIMTFEITSGQIRADSYVLNGRATTYPCDPTVSPDKVKLQIKGTCNTGDPQLGILQDYRDTAGNVAVFGAGISFADCFVT